MISKKESAYQKTYWIGILKMAGDFEQGMNRVKALSGATGKQFEKLETQAKDLGATTQFSAGQVADAMGFLAQSGFTAQEIFEAMPATVFSDIWMK